MARYFEADRAKPFEPMALVAGCMEHGTDALLLDRDALPAAFFELRSGVAGELVQKLTNYGLRLAAVVPDLASQPARFQEFAREANAGARFRFAATREEAIAWLEAAESGRVGG
jgi:hypothetical protein